MKFIRGNLLDQTNGILVHGVNCVGVMGKGIALDIRKKYPVVYNEYVKHVNHINSSNVLLGTIQVVRINPQLIIVNAFTQRLYGRYHTWGCENYDAICNTFARVNILANEENMPVYFPMIGAGYSGGNFSKISELINNTLDPNIESTLVVYE